MLITMVYKKTVHHDREYEINIIIKTSCDHYNIEYTVILYYNCFTIMTI